jgi:hypothetical protein
MPEMPIRLPFREDVRSGMPSDVPPVPHTRPMDLIKTPHGWGYPDPGPCPCGESAARRGWEFCGCSSASSGGHPSWRCRACDQVRTLGCKGHIEVPNEHAGRAAMVRP